MPTTDELFTEVYLHPADETQKLVLADRLLEDGDPRGEFIALQLRHEKGSLPPSGVKREKRLLEEHEAKWLGPIARAMIGGPRRWRHGFLEVCSAQLAGLTVGAREWSTVRELTLYSQDRDRPLELARDFRSLEVLERANTLSLDVLVKSPEKPPVRALSYAGPMRQLREWVPRQVDALLKLAELPYLTRLKLAPPMALEVTGKDFAFLFDSALAHRLEDLAIVLVRSFARARPETPIDLAGFLRLANPLPLASLTVEVQGLASYGFRRGADSLSSLTLRALTSPTVTGQYVPAMMAPLRGLDPKSLSRFELVYPGKRLAKRHLFAVEEAARRFKQVNAVEYRAAS